MALYAVSEEAIHSLSDSTVGVKTRMEHATDGLTGLGGRRGHVQRFRWAFRGS